MSNYPGTNTQEVYFWGNSVCTLGRTFKVRFWHTSHLTTATTGRPSIDPELMVRMLIVGYCFGIRSERRLCEEIHLNLAYRGG